MGRGADGGGGGWGRGRMRLCCVAAYTIRLSDTASDIYDGLGSVGLSRMICHIYCHIIGMDCQIYRHLRRIVRKHTYACVGCISPSKKIYA